MRHLISLSDLINMATQSNMGFWVKRLAVMFSVMGAALAFLLYVPEPGESVSAPAKPKRESKSISESVTNFYSEFRQSSRDPIKERYGDYTILLEDKQYDSVDEAIENSSDKDYPRLLDWQGSIKERAFPQDSTLKTEAKAYAAEEGLNLVWDLHQDFIVRHRFNSRGNLVMMLEEIAEAIDSNFNQPINVYFCQKKRALVITQRDSVYLKQNCEKSLGLSQNY